MIFDPRQFRNIPTYVGLLPNGDNAKDPPPLLYVHDGRGGKRAITLAATKKAPMLRVYREKGESKSNPQQPKTEDHHQPTPMTKPPTASNDAERRELNRLREQERIAELNDFARVVEKKSGHHEKTLQLLDEAKVTGLTLDQILDELYATL